MVVIRASVLIVLATCSPALSGCTPAQAAKASAAINAGVACWQAVMASELISCASEECRATVRQKYQPACLQEPEACEQAESIAGPVQ